MLILLIFPKSSKHYIVHKEPVLHYFVASDGCLCIGFCILLQKTLNKWYPIAIQYNSTWEQKHIRQKQKVKRETDQRSPPRTQQQWNQRSRKYLRHRKRYDFKLISLSYWPSYANKRQVYCFYEHILLSLNYMFTTCLVFATCEES